MVLLVLLDLAGVVGPSGFLNGDGSEASTELCFAFLLVLLVLFELALRLREEAESVALLEVAGIGVVLVACGMRRADLLRDIAIVLWSIKYTSMCFDLLMRCVLADNIASPSSDVFTLMS